MRINDSYIHFYNEKGLNERRKSVNTAIFKRHIKAYFILYLFWKFVWLFHLVGILNTRTSSNLLVLSPRIVLIIALPVSTSTTSSFARLVTCLLLNVVARTMFQLNFQHLSLMPYLVIPYLSSVHHGYSSPTLFRTIYVAASRVWLLPSIRTGIRSVG